MKFSQTLKQELAEPRIFITAKKINLAMNSFEGEIRDLRYIIQKHHENLGKVFNYAGDILPAYHSKIKRFDINRHRALYNRLKDYARWKMGNLALIYLMEYYSYHIYRS